MSMLSAFVVSFFVFLSGAARKPSTGAYRITFVVQWLESLKRYFVVVLLIVAPVPLLTIRPAN